MAGTLLCPLTCGFVKVAAYNAYLSVKDLAKRESEGNPKYNARKLQLRHDKYNEFFGQERKDSFEIPIQTFNKKLPDFIEFLKKWKSRQKGEKKTFLTCFSSDNWGKLSCAKKREHQLKACKGCYQGYSETQALFPVRSPHLKKFAKQNPFYMAEDLAKKIKPAQSMKPRKLQETTLKVYNAINTSFEKAYGTDFAQAQTKVKVLGVQSRQSKEEQKKEQRTMYRTSKATIENQWKKSDVDCLLETRKSYGKRQKERLICSFESKDDAVKRTAKRKSSEEAGKKKRKRHSPDPNNVTFDKDSLLLEVNNMKDGDQINYTALAEKHNISETVPKQNVGAVVKEFLESEVELSRFKPYHRNPPSVRRSLLRGCGGEITVPLPATNKEVKEKLEVRIRNKEYLLGELVVPRKYKKVVLGTDGTLKEECFTVSGRKIPLVDIRRRIMEKHEKLGIVRKSTDEKYQKMAVQQLKERLIKLHEFIDGESDQEMRERLMKIERTRNLSIWHDHSKVMNRGHMVFMVNVLYDEAFYYTDEEMTQMGHGEVDVQHLVEQPHIYIIGRSSDSEAEQLSYVETRLECIAMMNISVQTAEGVNITDRIRLFIGDHPAQEFECGEVKGGNDGCSGCAARSPKYNDLTYSFRSGLLSLADRQAVVNGGIHGRNNRNGGVKPFHRMTRKELEDELVSRGVMWREIMGKGKNDLEMQLREILGGVQRVPALLFGKSQCQLDEMGLQSYEMCPCEPLHDIKGHIKNILTELPRHLNQEEKRQFEEGKQLAFEDKQQLRGCDYRKGMVIITNFLHGKVRENIQFLLNSLVEISHLLYLSAQKRTSKMVLRLHNMTFLHAICIKEVMPNPQILTMRSLYGIYYHSIVCHSPQVARIIAPSSTNSEKQERAFNAINGICSATSSGRSGELLDNVLVRFQAEANSRECSRDYLKKDESHISKLSKALPGLRNSLVPKHVVLKHKNEYQAHLERIGDFLLCGAGVWWHEVAEGVEFFDGPSEPEWHAQGPPLHHFRSSDLKAEEKYLHECWAKLTNAESTTKVPHPEIKLYDSNGDRDGVIHNRMWTDSDMTNNPILTSSTRQPHSVGTTAASNGLPTACTPSLCEQIADTSDTPLQFNCSSSTTVVSNVDSIMNGGSSPQINQTIPVCDDHIDRTPTQDCYPSAVDPDIDNIQQQSTPNYIHAPPVEQVISLVATDDLDVTSDMEDNTEDGKREGTSNADGAEEDTIPQPSKTQVSRKRRHECTLKPQTSPMQATTKLGKNLIEVLGTTPLVQNTDKARNQWKKCPRNKDLEEKYLSFLARTQTEVLTKYGKIKGEIQQWEQEFFLQRGHRIPNLHDINKDTHISSLYKIFHLSKKLLEHWKITAHL